MIANNLSAQSKDGIKAAEASLGDRETKIISGRPDTRAVILGTQDGNVSAMERTAQDFITSPGSVHQSYSYGYDGLNRLVSAAYSAGSDGIMPMTTAEYVALNDRDYSCTYGYDATPFTVTTAQYDAIGRLLSEWRGTDVTYDYDIRGHVAGISSDVYSETAGYGDNPFNPQATSYKFLNYTTEQWKGVKPYTISMSYTYDGLGRMKNALSQGGEDGPEISETVDVDLDANVVGVMRRYKRLLVQDAVLTMDGGKAIAVNDASSPYYADRVGRFPDGSYSMSYDRNGRLTADGTRQIKTITYHKYIDRPNRITMDNGDYTVSQYLPDGTLTRRTFCSKRIETVTKVNADGDTIVRNVTRTSSNIHDYMGSFWTVRGETKARRVVTSAGYVDLTTGKRYWYVTNRQGSTMAVVDETGAVVQRNGYYPSGTPYVLPSETDAPSLTAVTDRLHIGNRWLSHSGLNWYDNTARMHDPLLMRFATPDPLWQEYPGFSPWSHCAANPVNAVDPDGREVFLFATELPPKNDLTKIMLKNATHTFIVVKQDSKISYFAYGRREDGRFAGSLGRMKYDQDKTIYSKVLDDNNYSEDALKSVIQIEPPADVSSEEFDKKVIETAKSFGNNPGIAYRIIPDDVDAGNCNTSTSTILLKAGVPPEIIKQIRKQIPGIVTGFNPEPKAWTAEEQEEAVKQGQLEKSTNNVLKLYYYR